MSKQVGLDMKLFRATGAPAWAEVENVRDLSSPDSFGETDVSIRGKAIKLTEPTLRDISIEWEMVFDETDVDFTAIRTAYTGKTLIQLALADGAIGTSASVASGGTAGVKYISLSCKILKFERNEALEGPNTYAVSAKPCYSAVAAPTVQTVS